MSKYAILTWWALALMAVSAAAQTVTGGGTTNTVPVFTGTSTVGNSPISVSNGNVGIGTTSPASTLDVHGMMQSTVSGDVGGVVALYNPLKTTSGTASIWKIFNMTNGYGNSMQFWAYDTIGCTTGGLCASRLTLMDNGNVGIGTTNPGAKLEVDGSIKLTASSGGSITFQDGTTQSTAFIPANCGADYAESVDVTGDRTKYEPGDILVIDPDAPGKFLKSNQAYSTLVAGIYSTKPGFVGRLHPEDAQTDKTEVPMAMVGRVPTKVTAENGPIKVGDLLVSSSTLGYAMKGTDRSQMLGAVIGKALGSLDSGTGVILVLVTLQ